MLRFACLCGFPRGNGLPSGLVFCDDFTSNLVSDPEVPGFLGVGFRASGSCFRGLGPLLTCESQHPGCAKSFLLLVA